MGRRRSASPLRRLGQRAVAAGVTLTARAVVWLPPRLGARLGAALGVVAYGLLPGRRRVALSNLSVALGSALAPGERAATARASFRHLGTTVVECCRLFLGRPEAMLSTVRVEGLEHIKHALADGRGAFYLTAHFGNWELLAAAHALTGLPLSVVVRPLDNPYLEAVLARGRERHQVRPIPKRVAVHEIRAALARNECIGILLDQNAGPGGVFVPFFGELASTSRSLAVLALKTGAAVLPAFIRRLPDGDHEVTIEPPVPLVRTGQLGPDVEANTARFTQVIEHRTRTLPEQWFWVHRRWKTRPVPAPAPDRTRRPDVSRGILAGLVALAVAVGGPTAVPPAGSAADPVAAGTTDRAPSGLVWGRLSVEEESPHGRFTPLAGVEVRAYPLTPGLLQELERIRDTARDSARQHDTAVARLRAALDPGPPRGGPASGSSRSAVEATPASGEEEGPTAPPATPGPTADPEKRRATDAAGVFVFRDLPPGDWLLVAIRLTPYASRLAQSQNPRGRRSEASRFSGPSSPAADVRHAEVWVAPVRVGPGERVRHFWTDRSRFMAGPLAAGGG